MREPAYVQAVMDLLEYESLPSRVAVRSERPGAIVDMIRVPSDELSARKAIHIRENERLAAALDEASASWIIQVPQIDEDTILAVTRGTESRVVMQRRSARQVISRLPTCNVVTEGELVRIGYFAAIGSRSMLVCPIADFFTADVYPPRTAYVVPPGAIEVWRDARGDAIRFSVVAKAPITRIVEGVTT